MPINPDFFHQFQQQLKWHSGHRWRLVCHVQLPERQAIDLAKQLLLLANVSDSLWIDLQHDREIKAYRNKLGCETQAVVFNAYQGLNPDLLGVSHGWVKAGGLFILITPPNAQWPHLDDRDYQRMDSEGEVQKPFRFISHCIQALNTPSIIQIREGDVYWPKLAAQSNQPFSGAEQMALIEKIIHFGSRKRREALVVSAPRGRGKSTAVGRALLGLLRLDARSPLRIGITALSQKAAIKVCHELARGLGESAAVVTQRFFFSPDQLILEQPQLDMLVVDEAAAIPVSVLKQLTKVYSKILFATTTQGYEGHGQGFAMRFVPFLNEAFRKMSTHSLNEPIRFGFNDPLERVVEKMLLLAPDVSVVDAESDTNIRKLTQDECLQEPELLSQVYGLLVEAHYQTRPDDLRLLLDHPALQLVVAEKSQRVIGVVMLFEEGGFDGETIHEFAQSPRRFRGHLTAQSLNHEACEGALEARYLRISRIAVHVTYRREGVGSALLDFVSKNASSSVNFLSTSFSLESDLVAFWQRNGFDLIKLGTKQNNATGLLSGLLLRPIDAQGCALKRQWQPDFFEGLLYQIMTQHQHLSTELIAQILKNGQWSIGVNHKNQCKAFVAHRLAFDQCRYSLLLFLLNAWGQEVAFEKRQIALALLDVLIKNVPLTEGAKNAKCPGKKAFIAEIKQLYQRLLNSHTC
ncbi:MAG: GNAT family N-acetyltransferase [Cellvibrionales bacterium]|nr:GNAT family N-acetyltransferase [Cellvibrionales bacterium]